ncbi:hypothetical protein K458DRAFT_298876 [Lentithecium fluviatile CBS 122367]|uniref:F-box domain-containing protein n=1 Tax=Lentithecium fluviatile CBS 122367 TaxID=1168545 RepID=A0A6G1J7F9_9PLEO|nr:hypothetical protein K458DRAFT_298876 [Lentithecium fluviatile CBS 122367]
MTAPIEQLPVELVDVVVKYIPLSDFQSFRLVSRQIYALTLSTFSSRYFHRRTTTLSAPSLDRLVRLSSCGCLSQSVSLLDVKLLNHDDYRNLQKISRVGLFPPPKRFQQVANIKPRDISQEHALFDYMRANEDPKDLIKSLSQALAHLPQLRAVRLRVNGVTLGNSRFDDEEEDYQEFFLACFKSVLNAIVKSGIKLHDFSVIKGTNMRPSTKSANLIYPAFDLSFSFLHSLGKTFTSLRNLSLSICTDWNGNARVPGWQNGMSKFISTASGLEELTLCFQARDKEPSFRAAAMHSLATTLELPKLKSLQLYGCVVDEQALSTFARAHAGTIRRLTFIDALLLNGSWGALLGTFRESLSLETIRLSFLQQNAAPRDIWWNGNKKRKSKIIMDTTEKAERRTMNEMLTEAIDYITLISTLPEPYSLPYSVLLAYTHHNPASNPA